MCRFLVYSGEPVLLHDLLFRPAHSIVYQSRGSREQEESLNPDGFGVGWYVHDIAPLPALFRSLMPAWSSTNLQSFSRLTRSSHVFAHVRSASDGIEVSDANCHPFNAGPFLWMHNGTVEGYSELREWSRHYLSGGVYAQIRGTTDSEIVFGLFLDLWDQAGSPSAPEGLLDVFRKTLLFLSDILRDLEVKKGSTLNFALTDGRSALVSRHATRSAKPNSLYLARGIRLLVEGDRCRIASAPDASSAIVASERLTDDSVWEECPPGKIIVIRPGGRVSVEDIGS